MNDVADEASLGVLTAGDTKLIFLRCTTFNMTNLEVAKDLGVAVTRVSVRCGRARRVADDGTEPQDPRSHSRTSEQNFRLSGLLGFDVDR